MTSDDAGHSDRERGLRAGATAGIRLSDVPGVIRLCEAWRQQSLSCGWAADDDWRVAAVDAVAVAAWRGAGLATACAGLGRERARAGIGIGETLTDLAALCFVLDGEEPPIELTRPLAEGWAEAGLATMSHGRCAADSHRLLVAELPRGLDPWDRLSALLLVSNEMRATFPGGETLSLAAPTRVIALVRAVPELQFRATGLRRNLAEVHGTRLRLITPPAQHEEALRLLDGLAH